MRGHDRVVAFGNQHQLTLTHSERPSDESIRRVNSLNRISLWRIHFVVVELFEIHFPGRAVYVMLVWRIAGPVSTWRVDLDEHQALRLEFRFQDVIDLTCRVCPAPDLDLHFVGRNESRRKFFFSTRVAKSDFTIR